MPDGGAAVGASTVIAERCFGTADQERFAWLSGDSNPMHMDAVAARRTPAGAPVVHGVHGLLWMLDEIACDVTGPLSAIEADFAQFLYVGEMARLHVVRRSVDEMRAEIRVGPTRVSQFVVRIGKAPKPQAPLLVSAAAAIVYAADETEPLALEAEAIAVSHGIVEFAARDDDVAEMFPRATAWMTAGRVGSLLALTRLVGMASPGLHSTFHRVSIAAGPCDDRNGRLRFAARPADRRFAVVTFDVLADGIYGSIKASRRPAPIAQPGIAELRGLIAPDAFAGRTALVIGGSRGLGELTAKLLAVGGASVALTYASGRTDAERVVEDLRSAACQASVFHLDCQGDIAGALAGSGLEPNSLYYFATPRISSRLTGGFSVERFGVLSDTYLRAFHDVVSAVSARADELLRVFYPSTVFISEPTKGMVEYAMAKAAGEVLCDDMSDHLSGVRVHHRRLPRLRTDQNAGLIERDLASPADVMAQVVMQTEGLN